MMSSKFVRKQEERETAIGFGRTSRYTELHAPLKSTVLDAEKYSNALWHFQFINRSDLTTAIPLDPFPREKNYNIQKSVLKKRENDYIKRILLYSAASFLIPLVLFFSNAEYLWNSLLKFWNYFIHLSIEIPLMIWKKKSLLFFIMMFLLNVIAADWLSLGQIVLDFDQI